MQGVEWIQLSQNRVKWRILLSTVMKLRAPQKAEML